MLSIYNLAKCWKIFKVTQILHKSPYDDFIVFIGIWSCWKIQHNKIEQIRKSYNSLASNGIAYLCAHFSNHFFYGRYTDTGSIYLPVFM